MPHPTRRIFVAGAALLAAVPGAAWAAADPENTIYLDTKNGRITIRLRPDLAPKHVAQIKALVRRGFYDGLTFHRVIDGFMAQTGDPNGNGTGGSDLPDLPGEFSKTEKFKRGTVGMARARSPNSANSQFFITFDAAPNLDGAYTIWGEVVSGMDVVDKIKKGDPGRNGTVDAPDKIVRMRVAADAK
ncbi:peptidylprolyl isomerase [Enterovirga sp.]|uniref:peptidylprolyl isomerase n=1 Tax=Enterovirga sp. TaxID=2026350 RepID=UPI002C8517F2|nr:peptidylprolyl isomerase [Enterovirga sp.]HMO28855.1 peptidylprolyl isomerase [Enterovirga sp.]